MKSPTFDCSLHGSSPCLVVCAHTLNGAPPVHFIDATGERNGEALCADCLRDPAKVSPQGCSVVCQTCFRILAQKYIRKLTGSLLRAGFRYGVPN